MMVAGTGKSSVGDRARRILLVDDHPLVREGLAEVLGREIDLVVCGEAEDRQQALELITTTQPHLAIVDLALKRSNGLELIKDIRVRYPNLPVLVVSMHDEALHAERALRAGASGYIAKAEAATQVVQAVRKVLAGGIYLSDLAVARLAAGAAGRSRAGAGGSVESLCDRELEVFELVGRGLTTRQIAQQMRLEVTTIETYRARIKEKLNLKDAAELLQHAIQWNLSRRL